LKHCSDLLFNCAKFDEVKSIHDILMQYWGFDSFRPLQEDIINAVLDGKDTLALLPTGGGKSLCYQVPGTYLEGVCIVVSPLIALMKDQVQSLNKRKIRAMALISGMRESEVDTILDNCIYGGIKFLYLSPERLKSDLVQERIKLMKVNLIAVDEAHCISQWGFDFRPSYREIAHLREIKPDVPILALTATATPEVADDIQTQLQFKSPNLLKKSFVRDNLAYMAFEEEDKQNKLRLMLEKNSGSVIIYMRSRVKSEKLANKLTSWSYSATFYHAGLSQDERQKRQKSWTSGETRIMVATNAFGMGIDKADVRLVVHLDIPESPEAYFQEAGRAGRDGLKSYAVMLFDKYDIEQLKERFKQQFPPIKQVKRAYTALGNHLQLAAGSGEGEEFEFDLNRLSSNFNMDSYEMQQCLKILELSELIQFSEESFLSSRLKIACDKRDLYHYEIAHPKDARLTHLLLRSNIGVFDHYVKINEFKLAQSLGEEHAQVRAQLERMDKLGIMSYIPHSNKPRVHFIRARLKDLELNIPKEAYRLRKSIMKKKLEAMLDFVETKSICRTLFLLDYFGEKRSKDCGICDICVARKKDPDRLRKEIIQLMEGPIRIDDLKMATDSNDEQLLACLRQMIDDRLIERKDDIYSLVAEQKR